MNGREAEVSEMPRHTEKGPNKSIDSWEAEKYAKGSYLRTVLALSVLM